MTNFLDADINVVAAPEFLIPENIINAAGYGVREVFADEKAIVFDDEHGVMHLLYLHTISVDDKDYDYGSLGVSVRPAQLCPDGPCSGCEGLGFVVS